ncbi:carboxymuconolactone decarboxylase family protein [Polymorphobacter fuscus]|nr:carboxymuconolactone decarboxylase family protein [Polymorphobacter fuscus]NJC08469.1 alkylhydroperoxidase family enzyme [Polymorphobacter fuscus]
MSRIGLLQKPWPDAFAATVAKVAAPGAEPLSLFTAMGHSQKALDRFLAGAVPGKGALDLHTREIVIERTAAQTGCEYEWGIHTKVFAAKAGLSPEQVQSTYSGAANDGNWDEKDAAVIATVDALLANKKLSDDEFARITAHFDTEQLIEIIQLVAFYHGVALFTGAIALPSEPGMPRFPAA